MKDLCEKHCSACKIGTPTIAGDKIGEFVDKLNLGWEAVDEKKIHRVFRFRDFKEGLDFVNLVGDLAESEGHHPDVYLCWGKVEITLWTHKAGGLTENDFIMAAHIDNIYEPSEG